MQNRNILLSIGCLLIVVATAIIALSLYAPSAYQKGGIKPNWHYFNIFFTYSLILVFIIPIRRFTLLRKILLSIPATIFGVIVAFVSTEEIVECLYGSDYEMYADKVTSNLMFYSLAFLCGVLTLTMLHYYTLLVNKR